MPSADRGRICAMTGREGPRISTNCICRSPVAYMTLIYRHIGEKIATD